ncbi:MAG: hypothetical protein AB7S44_01850 [Spirochaetales bacterium]
MDEQTRNIEKDKVKKLKTKKTEAYKEAIKARHEALNSTVVMDIPVEGSIMYFNNYSDIHYEECDMEKLDQDFREDAIIPNMHVTLGGDKIDMPLKDSVTSIYEKVTNPSEGKEMFAESVKESGILKNVDGMFNGNHGYRLITLTSFDANQDMSKELAIEESAAINQLELNYLLDDPIHPGKKVRVIIHLRHGEGIPANEGAAVDKMLQGDNIKCVDVYISEHTHKIYIGSSEIKIDEANRKNPKTKVITAVNFGSRQERSEYGDRAGYRPTPRVDGEILRIALVPNADKTDFSVNVDLINKRELLNNIVIQKMAKVQTICDKLEEKEYASQSQVATAYKNSSAAIYQNTLKPYKAGKEKNLFQPIKGTFIASWSGFVVGNSDVKNEKAIEKKIELTSKLNGSAKIFLNGDMVFYKKADFFKRQKFADDVFSYIELLAEKLEKVKHKIIGYNSGVEEQKMMMYQSKELAKYAMIRLQMDEKLVYRPYDKTKLLAEQKKIQAEQVDAHNKGILSSAINEYFAMKSMWEYYTGKKQYYYDMTAKEKQYPKDKVFQYLENLQKFDINFHMKNYKAIEDGFVSKLRLERTLLSLRKDREYIDYTFPLSAIELRDPHPNLIQHILCEFLGIDPKTIAINPRPNTETFLTLPIKTNKNRSKNLNLLFKYSKSVAKRSAQTTHFSTQESKRPKVDAIIVNTKGGYEYVTKQRSLDPEYKSLAAGEASTDVLKDIWYISAGRDDGSKDRVDQEQSVSKLYKFEWDESTQESNADYEGRDMYRKAKLKPSLLCSSVNYDSALTHEDVFETVVQNMVVNSFNKTYYKVAKIELVKNQSKAREAIEKALDGKASVSREGTVGKQI